MSFPRDHLYEVEYKLVRRGHCNKCGYCCGFRNGKKIEGACVHLGENGLCTIYKKLEEYCVICGKNHGECASSASAPPRPLRKENPLCGYRFYEEESDAEVIEIVFADWDFLSRTGG